jgi:hypothetical protein
MVIEDSLISVKPPPIPVEDDDVLRDSIDEPLKFSLRLLAILDIGAGGEPANDFPLFISERLAAN